MPEASSARLSKVPSQILRKPLFLLASFFLIFTGASAARQAQPATHLEKSISSTVDNRAETQPVFTSHAELVLVPALVRDKQGAPVRSLTKDDFVVQENGASQKIAFAEEVDTSPVARLTRRGSGPGVYTNALRGSASQTPRLNIVVLDTINTRVLDQGRARRALIQFLAESVNGNEMIALLALNRGGVTVIHDFTTDTSVLVAALRKVRGGAVETMNGENTDSLNIGGVDSAMANPASVDLVSQEVNSIESFLNAEEANFTRQVQEVAIQYTLDGFTALAHAFGSVPGRKSLIWVTGSFPFLIESPDDPPGSRGFTREMASVFQLLNDANIAVYPVDARGLFAGGLDASDPTPKRVSSRMIVGRLNSRMNFNTSVLQTMDSFAEMTGGRAFYNTNDLEHAFASASEDSSSYYLLGFYRRSGDDKPGWRRLTVKVPKHGLKVRARSGYFVNPRSSAPADHYQDLTIALSSPLDFIALPMALEWQPLTPGGDALKVPFILEIAFKLPELARGDPYHLNFVVAAVARNEKGEPGGHLAQTVDLHLAADASASNPDRVVRIQGKLELRARGEYTVRVAVRDNFSGQIGSLIAPVKVE